MSGMSQVNGNQSIGICIFIRVAWNLEIISKKIGTRCTRNLVGFIIRTILLDGTNHKSYGQNSGVCRQSFRINLKILCHTICHWLFIKIWRRVGMRMTHRTEEVCMTSVLAKRSRLRSANLYWIYLKMVWHALCPYIHTYNHSHSLRWE